MTERAARRRRLGGTVLMLLAAAAPHRARAQAKALTQAIDARLDAKPFDRQIWGVALVDERGRLLYGRNADRLLIPASNTKLLVSIAAASLLPADFTVRTSVYGTGPVRDGVLEGDLVLYGRGDPTLGARCFGVDTTVAGACDRDVLAPFRTLADALVARGIRSVHGAIIGDGSWFAEPQIHPFWEASDLVWWYAAPVGGLGVNDNSVDLHVSPAAQAGMPAMITLFPAWSEYSIENRTRTVAAGARNTIDFTRDDALHHVIVTGEVPLGAKDDLENVALPDPSRFSALALRAALADRGVAVLGETASTMDSVRTQAARATVPLAEVSGRPLRDWIFPILNTSQNWYADMLLKELGRQFGGTGSFDAGATVVRRFLVDSVGVDSTEFTSVDGSGLAYSNVVTPHAFTQLLRYIRGHRGWETFAPGLPQSGATGSLRTRFMGTPVAGRVRAKTGSITRVNTLSGYVDLPGSRYLTFSVMANNHTLPTKAILAQIDSVVVDFARIMEQQR